MNKKWLILTGSSRGIGRCLRPLLRNHFNLLLVTRQSLSLESGEREILWDLATPFNEVLKAKFKIFFDSNHCVGIFHLAGVLGPLGNGADYKDGFESYWHEYQEALQINSISPMQLTEFSLPHLKGSPSIILHMTSGAAKRAYSAWTSYCTSKASLYLYFKGLATRYSTENVLSISVSPGPTQTDMMDKITTLDRNIFPEVDKFTDLKKNNLLAKPEVIAEKILELVLQEKAYLVPMNGKFLNLLTGKIDD